MAKFNFSNFKESLNGLTKRAKNIKVKRSDSSRYSKGKRSAASDQSLGWRIAKYGFIGLLTFFVVCVIAGGSLFAYYVSSVPKLTENKLQSTNSSKIYDANGSLIADLGAEKRESASTDEIPTTLVNAITSIEDKRFFTHRGIDVYRIMGAAVNNLRRSSTQGGSTLDQQLIKLAYFSTNTSDQTLKRKSQEIWLSLQMERQFTKQEILTFYINKVYMGNGYYGMKTAAKSYFGKDLSDLSVAQAALLAGIPQAPTQYDPYANPDAAKERRNTVLSEMYEDKNISKEEYEQAKATDVSDGLLPLTKKASYELYLDNYIKQVIEQVSTDANAKYSAIENAVTHNGLLKSIETRQSEVENDHVFSIDLTKDEVSNQKASGRCWMFAALNTFRHKLISDFKLESFELSQAHTFFWDKYEKSNWFLEQIIATADQEIGSRKVKFLLDTPQQDGGQWDMVVSLFEKYGVVPKSVYPESVASSNSRELNQYLNKLLRQDAQILRDLIAGGADQAAVQAKKEELLQEIFNYLAMTLGLPPRQFDFAYRDKDDNYQSEKNITPQAFFEKYVGLKLSDYVSVINAPTADKPYGKSYTVEMLGNVVGAPSVRYINLPMDRFKELAIAQMKAGETVWFGSDVGQVSDRQKGILATNVYDFTASMDINLTQDKAGRLDYSESLMTHAMVLTGVDLDADGKPVKWKVENSWGDKVGQKGYFVASDAWMDEYTYQIVVRKDFLTAEELAAYEAEPQVLAPWDPMGALASK